MIANTAQRKYKPTGAAFEDVTVGKTRYLSARQGCSCAPLPHRHSFYVFPAVLLMLMLTGILRRTSQRVPPPPLTELGQQGPGTGKRVCDGCVGGWGFIVLVFGWLQPSPLLSYSRQRCDVTVTRTCPGPVKGLKGRADGRCGPGGAPEGTVFL